MDKSKIKKPKDLAETIIAKLILKSEFNIEIFIDELIAKAKDNRVFDKSSNKWRDYGGAKHIIQEIIKKGL